MKQRAKVKDFECEIHLGSMLDSIEAFDPDKIENDADEELINWIISDNAFMFKIVNFV